MRDSRAFRDLTEPYRRALFGDRHIYVPVRMFLYPQGEIQGHTATFFAGLALDELRHPKTRELDLQFEIWDGTMLFVPSVRKATNRFTGYGVAAMLTDGGLSLEEYEVQLP